MSNLERPAGMLLPSLTLALLLAVPVRAEVGVFIRPDGLPLPYVLKSIIDEPEPIDSFTFWLRHSPDLSNRHVLNEGGFANQDGRPSLIMSWEPGFPLAAWSRNSPEGYDIVISRFDGSDWTPPQVVAGAGADELDPHLSVDPGDGSIHLVYWIDDGAPRVMHRQAPADLSGWSAPQQVSEQAGASCRPSGAFHEGVLHVAYELHDLGQGTTPRHIMLAVREGGSFSSQVLTPTQHAGENRPEVHSANGRLWVDWIDSDCEAAWTRRAPGGGWEPVLTEPFASPEERDFHVRGRIRQLAAQ